MAEIFGTIVAVASLVELFGRGRDRFQKAAEKLESFEKSRISGISQIQRLRIVYRNIAIIFGKYNRDVECHLSEKDRDDIRSVLQDMSQNADRCESTISDLKLVMRSGSNKNHEIERLRQDLRDEVELFMSLQNTLTSHMTFENFRRFSEAPNNYQVSSSPELIKPPFRRTSTGNTTLSSTSSKSSGKQSFGGTSTENTSVSSCSSKSSGKQPIGGISRQNTDMSERTLGGMSTISSALTRVGTSGSLSSSSGSSTNSTKTIRFFENQQLRAAIDEKDSQNITRLIQEANDPIEIESRKASALLLACRYRRASIVQWLLRQKASVDLTDEAGLGVLHATIGQSEVCNDNQAKETVVILQMLVAQGASISAREELKERKTPLHYCAITGNYHAARYLLSEEPGTVDITDTQKKTALYHACEHHSPSARLVGLLLDKKATFQKRHRPRLGNEPRFQIIKRLLNETEKKRGSLCA